MYSTVAIKEDGIDTKTVVPIHWVNADEGIVYYPPRGKKPVGVYLSEWASPEPGWQEFILLEYILESGSYETCQAMLNFLTEDENDDRPGKFIYLFIRLFVLKNNFLADVILLYDL